MLPAVPGAFCESASSACEYLTIDQNRSKSDRQYSRPNHSHIVMLNRTSSSVSASSLSISAGKCLKEGTLQTIDHKTVNNTIR